MQIKIKSLFVLLNSISACPPSQQPLEEDLELVMDLDLVLHLDWVLVFVFQLLFDLPWTCGLGIGLGLRSAAGLVSCL